MFELNSPIATVNAVPKVAKPKLAYDATIIPNTSDKKVMPSQVTKIGLPRGVKHRVKKVCKHKEYDLEDMVSEKEVVASLDTQLQGQCQHAGLPKTSSRSVPNHNDEDEEMEESELEDDLIKLGNNACTLLKKLHAEVS